MSRVQSIVGALALAIVILLGGILDEQDEASTEALVQAVAVDTLADANVAAHTRDEP